MFRRKKKEEAVKKAPLSIEQLLDMIKGHPNGLKFEEIQKVLSEKNVDAEPSALHEMLLKLEQDEEVKSEIRMRKEVAGWDRYWKPALKYSGLL
jgi:hypothetical protein